MKHAEDDHILGTYAIEDEESPKALNRAPLHRLETRIPEFAGPATFGIRADPVERVEHGLEETPRRDTAASRDELNRSRDVRIGSGTDSNACIHFAFLPDPSRASSSARLFAT